MTPAVLVTATGVVCMLLGVWLFSPRLTLVVGGLLAALLGLLVDVSSSGDGES